MTDTTKMVFEVENLNNASPATVSRCGIIFVSHTDLSWKPLIETWIKDRQEERKMCNPDEGQWAMDLTDKYIEKPGLFDQMLIGYNQVMPTPPVVLITQHLNLITSLLS